MTHGSALRAGSSSGGEDGGEQRSRGQEQRERRGEGGGVGGAGEERRRRKRAAGQGPEATREEGSLWLLRASLQSRARCRSRRGGSWEKAAEPCGRVGALGAESRAAVGCWVSPREARAVRCRTWEDAQVWRDVGRHVPLFSAPSDGM